jgi:dethiobiotin synthetase
VVACFVTGTDTEVGKTFVSCALLWHLRRRCTHVVGMKPVAAGAVPDREGAESHQSEDALALRAFSNLRVPFELDNPYCLALPLSPHLAAQAAGQCIDVALLAQRYAQLAQQVAEAARAHPSEGLNSNSNAGLGAVVVEGAGGFHVPLNEVETGADLAAALGLPVLLVVGLRLGCLNHALLTQEAIHARGLTLAGWVANRIDPLMQAQEDNIATLRARLSAPLWADIAHMPRPQVQRVGWGAAVDEWVNSQ